MFLNDYSGCYMKNGLGQGARMEVRTKVWTWHPGTESVATLTSVVSVRGEDESPRGRVHERIAGKELQPRDRIAWRSVLRLGS